MYMTRPKTSAADLHHHMIYGKNPDILSPTVILDKKHIVIMP
jgi:hypothetical protein